MVGGELTLADEWTKSLLTNSEVLNVDQHSKENHPVIATDDIVIWTARPLTSGKMYLAAFNRSESSKQLRYSWNDVGMPGKTLSIRDLWGRKSLGLTKCYR